MAGRRAVGSAKANGGTCQLLLQKLQEGQDDLHRSLQRLQPSKKRTKRGHIKVRVTNVRYEHGGSDPLCCVQHLPLRRARTDQLSPDTQPSHGHRKKIRKRLSSTPKHSILAHPPPLPHSHVTPYSPPHTTDTSHHYSPPLTRSHITPSQTNDVSLENALLSQPSTSGRSEEGRVGRSEEGRVGRSGGRGVGRSKGGRVGRSGGGRVEDAQRRELVGQSENSLKRQSKEGSKGVTTRPSVGSGSGVAGSSVLQSSLSRIARDSESLHSRYETRRRKPRGLTVSFMTDDNSAKKDSSGGTGHDRGRSGDMSYAEEKGKRERLMSSLNSSCFGALEHHRRKSGLSCTKVPKPGDGERRTGDGERRTGDGERWTGDGERWTGDGERRTGDGERRTGDGERWTGDGERWTGDGGRWTGDERMLGYDWIAGLVDAGSQLEEKEDEYFVEMREFRKVNNSECSRPHPIFLPETDESPSPSLSPPLPSLSTSHSHCTQSYVLNDRLFPVCQRDSGACGDVGCGKRCPVCEGRRGDGGGSERKVMRYIRVSVPRRSVQAPYQLRPHRRRSFDPSDSMALNKHCLAGWNSTKPLGLSPQPTVDLKSAITHSPPHTQTHTHHSPPHHTSLASPLTRRRRKTKSSTRLVSRRVLNTSHSAEYTIRSRGHAGMRCTQ